MKKMSISFWYKCTDRFEELQGLVTNGDCVSNPSIRIASRNGTIEAWLTTTSGKVKVKSVPVRPLLLASRPGAKTIKKNPNSSPNKSQTQRARAYEVKSFLSTDCELSTNPCSRFLYSLGPRAEIIS